MGPGKCPDDFSLAADTLSGTRPLQRRRLCKERNPFVDDFAVVTGRCKERKLFVDDSWW